eukprot:3728192-Prorocentrum_lima.AAC.1
MSKVVVEPLLVAPTLASVCMQAGQRAGGRGCSAALLEAYQPPPGVECHAVHLRQRQGTRHS